MKFFNSQTGTMEEIECEKKSYFQMWLERPRKDRPYREHEYVPQLVLKLLATFLIALVLSITAYNMHLIALNTKLAIEQVKNGYCQVPIMGVGGAVWQKCK